ncbi:MAG: putative porin [Treponema sp.]|nr:putative porin [Treponema sp.]
MSHSNYIYSQFEHVAGTPAPEGIHGVTITKLKTLDVLIDKLVEIKKEGTSHINLGGSLSDDRIDALIRQYEYQIRQAKAATVALSAMSVSEDSSGGVLDFMV